MRGGHGVGVCRAQVGGEREGQMFDRLGLFKTVVRFLLLGVVVGLWCWSGLGDGVIRWSGGLGFGV